jgi:transcriptional regulator with XRE-family HTH domain
MHTIDALLDEAKAHSAIGMDRELAARVGVNKASICQWRKGRNVPGDEYASALANLTGEPEDYILFCFREARLKQAASSKVKVRVGNMDARDQRRIMDSWKVGPSS